MSNRVFRTTVRRIAGPVVEATSATGGRVVMGPKGTPDAFTPVELLLAAIGGCSGVDLDVVGGQAGTDPGAFELRIRGVKPSEATALSRIDVEYVIPELAPDVAESLAAAASELCTVSITLGQGVTVDHHLGQQASPAEKQ